MTEFKGTKGDWFFDGKSKTYPDGDYFNIVATHKEGIKGENIIAELDLSDQNFSEMQANAKLIAAAPKLLESIKKAMSISDLWMPSDENISEEFMDEMQAISSMYFEFQTALNLAE
jgi:hypothetical protein